MHGVDRARKPLTGEPVGADETHVAYLINDAEIAHFVFSPRGALVSENIERLKFAGAAFDLLHASGAEGRFPVSTGLGLYVTRQWLRQEGGDLEPILPVSTDGGGGFAMRLPLAGSTAAAT